MRALLAAAAVVIAACGGTAAPSPAPIRTVPLATVAPTAQRTPSAAPCATASQSGPAARAIVELANGRSFTIQLRADKAPNTVANFAKSSRECRYDNLSFHRVEASFVIQGGDPLGNGTGGGTQPTELSDLQFVKGAVGIARGGNVQVSNSMQFFVCIGSCRHLDGAYTNFGTVISGQEVADAVRVGDRIRTVRIE